MREDCKIQLDFMKCAFKLQRKIYIRDYTILKFLFFFVVMPCPVAMILSLKSLSITLFLFLILIFPSSQYYLFLLIGRNESINDRQR